MRQRLRMVAILATAQVLALVMATTVLPSPASAETKTIGLPSGPEVTVNFVGDILLAHGVGDLILQEGPLAPWAAVKDVLASADITVGNLECPVGTTGTPLEGKEYTFRARPQALEGLVQCGFDVVSLANNHTLDYGIECMLETMTHLDACGISHVGAGTDASSAWQGRIVEVRGLKIGFLATTMVYWKDWWRAGEGRPGVAADSAKFNKAIVSRINSMKAEADLVVVLVHWGYEHTNEPEDWVLTMWRALLDAGADVIIGSHPHVLRGFAYDGKHFTAFSLGNFVFITNPKVPACQTGGVLRLTLTREGVKSARLYPTTITWGRTAFMTDPSAKGALFSSLDSLSRRFNTRVDGDGNIWEARFHDLVGHWALPYVMYLSRAGLVGGLPDGTFRPDDPLTVEQWACLLATAVKSREELLGLVAPEGFNLCPIDRWSYPYLVYMASSGALAPHQAGFDPATPVSRVRVAHMLWQAQGKPAVPPQVPLFDDIRELSDEERRAILWCRSQGLFEGYGNNTVGPHDILSRAQGAVLIWKLLSREQARSPG